MTSQRGIFVRGLTLLRLCGRVAFNAGSGKDALNEQIVPLPLKQWETFIGLGEGFADGREV